MKISFVLPSIGVSGGMKVIYKYCSLLEEKGHEVIVYKEYISPNFHRYNLEIMNYVHKIYCSIKTLISSFKKISKYDKYVFKVSNSTIEDCDVIIATAWTTAYRVDKLSNVKWKKFYFIQDYEHWDNNSFDVNSYLLPLKKIVISSWINEQLNQNLNIAPYPIIYNGIDRKIFKENGPNKDNYDSYNFLMLNHLLPKKGVSNGLKVFERILETYPNSKLVMFGTCDNSNLPKYVDYVQNPSKEELVKLYCSSDIFIFPSLEEGWGLTRLEAMACGCVVVGTNTGFVLDLGINKVNMMISETGDLDKMYENICNIIENKDLFENLKSNQKSLLDMLSWDKSCDKLLHVLKNDKYEYNKLHDLF